MVAEAWVDTAERLARYLRPDEMHQRVQLPLPRLAVGRQRRARGHRRLARGQRPVGAPSHLGAQQPRRRAPRQPLGRTDPASTTRTASARATRSPTRLGLQRARAASALMLARSRGRYLYQGEELGLPEQPLPTSTARTRLVPARQRARPRRLPGPDPVGRRRPAYSPRRRRALAAAARAFAAYAVDRQAGVAGSTLELYRAAAGPARPSTSSSRRPRRRGRPCPPRRPCPTRAGRTASCCRPRRRPSAHRRSW